MTKLKRRILVGTAMALLAGCGSTEVVTGSVTAADTSTPTWVYVQAPYPCIDTCEKPTCDCFDQSELCAPDVALDGPCSSIGAQCDIIYSGTLQYATVKCTPPPPPVVITPHPTWTNVSGSIESCYDICGVGNCNCVRSRCAAGTAEDADCTNVGASCNLVGVNDYRHLTCKVQ